MALGAAALGAALGASPAHADSPSPSRLPPLEVATSPQALSVSVDDVVEVQLDVPLPVRTTAVPLPLPSTDPLPLPSIEPPPLPPPLPVPTLSARPVPTVSARPATTAPRRPARAPSSPRTTPTPAAPVPTAVRVDQSAPSTVSPGGAHGRSDGRASDRARPTTATVTGERPVPPARPAPGPPVFVVALATGPATTSTGGAEPPPSTAEAPPSIPLLRAGFTVSAVDLRATGLPVERGPPPPR
ncbi:hypothetical protein ACIP95_06545 [Micromonospora parva]|uniref:hypothetical protein n=1 Tax=Micromonospora parva TaxID=1464048 RepID=UPI0037F9F8E8